MFRRSSFQKHARRLPRARLLRLIGLIVVLALAGLLGDQFPARPIPPANEAWTIQTVHDGDTVTAVAADGREERIRLLGIDAPEYRQPHGRAARALRRFPDNANSIDLVGGKHFFGVANRTRQRLAIILLIKRPLVS